MLSISCFLTPKPRTYFVVFSAVLCNSKSDLVTMAENLFLCYGNKETANEWTCTLVGKKFYPRGYLHLPNCHWHFLSSSYAYGRSHCYSHVTMLLPPVTFLHIKEKEKLQHFPGPKGFKWNTPWVPLKIYFLSLTSFLNPQQAHWLFQAYSCLRAVTLAVSSTWTFFVPSNTCILSHSYLICVSFISSQNT